MNRNDRIWNVYLLYILLAVVFTVIAAIYPHTNEAYNNGAFTTIDSGVNMTDTDGQKSLISLPHFVRIRKGGEIEISMKLPDDIADGQTLFMYTGTLNNRVYIDGICRGAYMASSTFSSGVKIPAEWYMIRIGRADSGKKLIIMMGADSRTYMGWLEKIYAGDRLAIIYHLIAINLFPVVAALILLLMGALTVVTYISFMRGKNEARFIFMGVSMLMMALQVFLHSNIRQVFMQNMNYAAIADRLLLLLAYVPLILFLVDTGKEHRRPAIKNAIAAFISGTVVDSFFRYALGTNLLYWCYVLGILVMYSCFMYLYIQQLIYESRKQREAYMLNEAKTQFLADMSHAIRTPVNAIMGMDTMILRDGHEEKVTEYATDIKNAVASLLSIIDDVLDFSKIESGKLEINPMEYDLSSLIYDCFNMTIMRAKEKGLVLRINNDRSIPNRLYGDELRIRQVIINILTNAEKYTHEGHIDFNIGFSRHDDAEMIDLILDIKDTGIGIKKENMEKLFTSYERIDELNNRGIEGTGLGLSITKELVTRMDGTISVESEYGKGSAFRVVLPQRVIEEEPIGDYAERIERLRNTTADRLSWFYAPKARILVIDDVEMNLKVMKALLSESHVQVDTVMNGQDCLNMIKRNRYDIIFLDHMMPVMDGIETFRAMKAIHDQPNRDTPVIMLTANAVMGAREKYLAEGFSDYMSKPVEERELIGICRKYLNPVLIEDAPEKNVIDGSSDTGADSEAKLDRISGLLNISEGLMYCMDRKEFYLEMIRDFMSSDRMDMIKDSFAKKDYDSYRINVHALKSSAHMLGADGVSEEARQLEAAAASGDTGFILENNRKLVEDHEQLVAALLKNISTDDGDNSEPVSDIAEDEFKALLHRISGCADDFDIDGAEKALGMIMKYKVPEKSAEDMKILSKAVNDLDYDVIKEIAEKILSM